MRKERDKEKILTNILNKMLEHHNIDIKYIMSLPRDESKKTMIEGIEWFKYYTMTTEQHEAWKTWTMEYLKTTCIYKSMHSREFDMVNLMYGLQIKDN